MLTATIKIENNNLDKAKVEVQALLVYIDEMAKTYETTFKDEPKKPTTRKPRAKKTETAVKDVETPKEVSEPVKEEKTATELSSITLEALTEQAKGVVKAGFRDEAKALISEYSTSGKLSSVPDDKYDELSKALATLGT